MGILRRVEVHGKLLGEMVERTGADFANLDRYLGDNVVRSAIFRCIACPSEEECRAWLAAAPADSAPPEFCRNAAMMRSLKQPARQVDWL